MNKLFSLRVVPLKGPYLNSKRTRADGKGPVPQGLKKLRTMLEKYQGILEMMQPENGEAAN
jgi:hypothetical protein